VQRVGYNPEGLVDMLTVMEKKLKPGGLDFAKTHPAPRDRITEIQSHNQTFIPVATPNIRQERFLKAIGPI
jgi:predicted Zn-dependent protease